MASCGNDEGARRTLTIVLPEDGATPSAEDQFAHARLVAFGGPTSFLVCGAENPDADPSPDPPALTEATWNDPLGSAAPRLSVPPGEVVTFIVEGYDDADVLRLWGCDEDGDFTVELSRPCTSLDPAP